MHVLRFALILCFLFFCASLQAATHTVTSTADSGAGTLRQAVSDASSGDIINFAVTGTITLTTGQIEVDKSLTIQGPGGDILAVSSQGAPNRVFYFSSGTISVSGISITNGNTLGYAAPEGTNGGCILNAATLTLDSVAIGNCTAPSSNGGAIATSEDIVILNSSIEEGDADYGGALIVPAGVSAVLNGVTISQSVAVFLGGGVYNEGTLEVSDSLFILNTSDSAGGIMNIGGIVTVNSSTISSNSATSGFGGGVYGLEGTVTLTNVAMAGNTASSGAGIFMEGFPTGDLVINGATISNNIASDAGSAEGGGLFINGTSVTATLTNVTIANNQANGTGFGGGLAVDGGSTATLNNVTIAGNTAASSGGGILVNGGGTANVANSIFADNDAPASDDCVGTLNSLDYNLIEDTTGCTISGTTTHNITGEDPELGTLQNNGGDLNTMALATTSPALNAANPASPGSGGAACAVVDERGVSRPQETLCDMGAFELAPGLIALSSSTYSVNQTASSVTITVQRTSDSNTFDGSVSVNYSTSDGTAVAGTNYTASSGTLTWSSGDSTAQTVVVPILNAGASSNLTFNFILSDPTGGASLINPTSAVVTIVSSSENDVLSGTKCSLSRQDSVPISFASFLFLLTPSILWGLKKRFRARA